MCSQELRQIMDRTDELERLLEDDIDERGNPLTKKKRDELTDELEDLRVQFNEQEIFDKYGYYMGEHIINGVRPWQF